MVETDKEIFQNLRRENLNLKLENECLKNKLNLLLYEIDRLKKNNVEVLHE